MTSLIIVDYQSISKTIGYIQSFLKAVYEENLHIVIVDNSDNPEKGIQILEKSRNIQMNQIFIEGKIRKGAMPDIYATEIQHRELLYVCARENLGFAKGNNLGAMVAQLYFNDAYYLFSNNDLRFLSTFSLEDMRKPMLEDKKVAVVGPGITGLDGKEQSPRKYVSHWNKLFLYYFDLLLPKGMKIKGLSDIDQPRESGRCYWVTGSFLYVDARKFHEVEGFDEHTFLYYEEVILAERLAEKGYYMYYMKEVSVVHEHGQTVKKSMNVLDGIEISYRSSQYYFSNYKKVSRWLINASQIHFYLFKFLFGIKKRISCK